MIKRLRLAIEWRLRFISETVKRLKWDIKFKLYNNTHKVDGITLVVVGRNDNYGGDFSSRLKTTIDWNYKNLPNPELIYIEWNAVEDRQSDCEWIAKRYSNVKCYIVPKQIHEEYCNNSELPVMEYFAKNLGIRKASNNWVVLLNADVLLGLNTINNIEKLNKKYVYSAHYNNIKWDNQSITKQYLTDKSIVLNYFSSNNVLGGLVGNVIVAHKDLWVKARGYDESLKDVRKGVDSNGLLQLFHHGAKPMILGDHFHLDHQESVIHGGNITHGFNLKIDKGKNIPYHNPDNWGLNDYPLIALDDNIWQLKKI